jgi:hypothetical protein
MKIPIGMTSQEKQKLIAELANLRTTYHTEFYKRYVHAYYDDIQEHCFTGWLVARKLVAINPETKQRDITFNRCPRPRPSARSP